MTAARAWAALNAPDRAFLHLNRALDGGWDDAPDLECAEFGGLRGAPEWQRLVERMGE